MLINKIRSSFLRAYSRHLNSRGDTQWRKGNLTGAEQHFRAAIANNRANAAAYSNLGAVLIDLHQYEEGMADLEYAARLNPYHPGILVNLGNAYHQSGRVGSAIRKYTEALAIDPEHVEALANIFRALMETCDWPQIEKHFISLQNRMTQGDQSAFRSMTPFNSLFLPFDRSEQLAIAQFAAREIQEAVRPKKLKDKLVPQHEDSNRIRIGYLSSDFHDHATAHLTLGLYENHDRRHFEIYAYSLGYPDNTSYRQKIARDCDKFVEVYHLDAVEIAERIRRDRIDILVDLKGYTGGSRPSILALRAAPLQVNYLGYPGTMGATFVDYLIADPITIPETHAIDYSETVIRLPDSYQATDDRQPIATSPVSRQQNALPEDAFVYCCFNTSAKIDRRTFTCWTKILAAVPNSVLWLLKPPQECTANLEKALSTSGVDPRRIVYASPLPKAQHLARLQLADLVLDTFIYNAHTTTTDALWAGVPVVTLTGQTFASRVASSLLTAVGLNELISSTESEYVELATRLASEAGRLSRIRQNLAHRDERPLFNTAHYVSNLEGAYLEMLARRRTASPPFHS